MISYVTLDTLPHLHVPWHPFLKMKKDDACLAVYLMGVLAVQMSSCSVYEVLKGKMLVECEVGFCCTKYHYSLVLHLLSAHGRISAVPDGRSQDSAFPHWPCRITSWKCLMEDLWCHGEHVENGVMVKRPKVPSHCY